MKSLKLSVLDQSVSLAGSSEDAAIRDTVSLAEHCDALGYSRFWLSEHHGLPTIVGSAPVHDLLLAVDGDAAAGELDEVDAMPPSVETQFGAGVRHALLVHPGADAGIAQRLRSAVFQYPRTYPVLDVFAVAALEHRRLDALQMQQLRQQQSRRPGTDDHHLRAHCVAHPGRSGSSSRKSAVGHEEQGAGHRRGEVQDAVVGAGRVADEHVAQHLLGHVRGPRA